MEKKIQSVSASLMGKTLIWKLFKLENIWYLGATRAKLWPWGQAM